MAHVLAGPVAAVNFLPLGFATFVCSYRRHPPSTAKSGTFWLTSEIQSMTSQRSFSHADIDMGGRKALELLVPNLRSVYCSISTRGIARPKPEVPAHDRVTQAYSGM